MTTTLDRSAAPPPAPAPSQRHEGVVLGVVVVIMAVVAGAFAAPWYQQGPAAGSDLARFGRSVHGDAWLQATRDADGTTVSWTAGNTVVQPGFRAILDWRPAPRDVLRELADPTGTASSATQVRALGELEAYETRSRVLGADGSVSEERSYTVLTADHLLLIGIHSRSDGSDGVFDPPLPLLQRDLSLGASWSTEGTFRGVADYTWDREVVERGPATTALGRHDDCVLIRAELSISQAGERLLHNLTRERWCAGAGAIETTVLDPDTDEVTSTLEVTTSRDRSVPGLLPPARPTSPADEALAGPSAPGGWAWTRHGRVRDGGTATIPPTWVEAATPLVLVAGLDDDLVAFRADAPGEPPAWRFRTGGTIHSQPLHDPTTGRLFFGSTDRHVYALDDRGLFLWAFDTGDNVATRPALAGDVLVAGSEDRTVYGIDAASGEALWEVAAGGPVVASPVVVEDVVAIGSDDGAIRGIAAATGDVLWTRDLGDAVTAPLASTGEVVIAATTGGAVVALDGRDGTMLWEAAVPWPIRTAPLVTEGAVVSVHDGGGVVAWDAASGRQRWERPGRAVGAPALVDGVGVAVATSHGEVELLGIDAGERLATWDADDGRGVDDGAVAFDLGPTVTPHGLWTVDDATVLRRLGATTANGDTVDEGNGGDEGDGDGEDDGGGHPDDGQADAGGPPAHLSPAWLVAPDSEPWTDADVPAHTPLPYRDQVLLSELGGRLFTLDPDTGTTQLLGSIPIGDRGLFAESAVDDDRLYLSSGAALLAVDLPEVEVAWRYDGQPLAARPPIVAGDDVVWVSAPGSEGDPGATPVLSVLDAADGTVRWTAPLPNDTALSGATVDDDTVFTHSGAFDLATGTVQWTSPLELPGTGSPALSDDGRVLYVSTSAPEDADNGVAALDAATGDVLWRSQADPPIGLLPLGTTWPSGDTLVVPTIDWAVVGLDAASGVQRWRYEPPHPTLGTISVDDGHVWLATENAGVIVLDATTGAVRHRFDDLDTPVHHYALAQRPGRVGDHMVVAVGRWVIAFDVPSDAGLATGGTGAGS